MEKRHGTAVLSPSVDPDLQTGLVKGQREAQMKQDSFNVVPVEALFTLPLKPADVHRVS